VKERTLRQQQIYQELERSSDPVTGSELAIRLGVTRQVVVHDIALLRAQGVNIVSTPRGYIVSHPEGQKRAILAVCHPPDLTSAELYTLVDHGITVLDVQIEHPVYGELIGSLHLSSRRDVQLFMEKINAGHVSLLSSLTDGYHFHTVEYREGSRFEEAISALKSQGIKVLD